jgi:hypothetical protein
MIPWRRWLLALWYAWGALFIVLCVLCFLMVVVLWGSFLLGYPLAHLR